MKARENVRTRHDEWVKRALSLWLDGLGDVQIDARIAGESRRGDVLYAEKRGNPARRRALGLLGELARGHVLFEPFRNPITARELMTCVLKVIDHTAQRARAARRAKQRQSTVKGTVLCVITPSLSADFLAEAEARPLDDEKPGVYGLAALWRTVILVVDKLPEEGSTLWLRLLGRGAVQARAGLELLAMGTREPLRDATMELLVAWQQSLPVPAQQTEDEREMTMNLERVYERWERKVTAKSKAEAVVAVLETRGLSLTAAQRKQVLGCSDNAQLEAWLRAAVTTPNVKALLAKR